MFTQQEIKFLRRYIGGIPDIRKDVRDQCELARLAEKMIRESGFKIEWIEVDSATLIPVVTPRRDDPIYGYVIQGRPGWTAYLNFESQYAWFWERGFLTKEDAVTAVERWAMEMVVIGPEKGPLEIKV